MKRGANPKGAHWAGNVIKMTVSGHNLFYNEQQQLIIFETHINPNNSWILYTYPTGGNYIEARVDTLVLTTFLGKTDSVKFISLKVKNQAGNIINSPAYSHINTTILLLSKSFGLLNIPDIYSFPPASGATQNDVYGTSYVYTLIGMKNPDFGYKKLTRKEIYDFEVGQEIHRSQTVKSVYYSNPPYDSSFIYYQFIDKILARTDAPDDSSVTYTVQSYGRYYTSINPMLVYWPVDTLSKTYYYYSPATIKMDKVEPLEFYSLSHPNFFYTMSTMAAIDHSEQWITTFREDYFKYGGSYTSYLYENPNHGETTVHQLQYLQRSGYTFGTPYYFPNAGIEESTADNSAGFEVFPNPASTMLHVNFIKIKPANALIRIVNMQGQEIRRIQNETSPIDISDLKAGLYTIQLISGNRVMWRKFIKN
jgi:hypothetical protein